MTMHPKNEQMNELANEIMRFTSERSDDGQIIVSALWRAIAGFYARCALDHGDPSQLAAAALTLNAAHAADLARRLLDEIRSQP